MDADSAVKALEAVRAALEEFSRDATAENVEPALAALETAAEDVSKSWSGSWIGYHSRVYYRDFQVPPRGARFNAEWGLMTVAFSQGTKGDWVDYPFDEVISEIHRRAGNPKLDRTRELDRQARELFEASQAEMESILTALPSPPKDSHVESLIRDGTELTALTQNDVVLGLQPRGQFIIRDTTALSQGQQVPPHVQVLAQVIESRDSLRKCSTLAALAGRAATHVQRVDSPKNVREPIETSVFIGHGRSPLWRELKDFLQDRLRLSWGEFNRVPAAGVATSARLAELLDASALAFLILTGEDEDQDGLLHARQNVIHEAGLFQGRLGFTRAIVLLEEGCEEFSNIHGLGQIRFPQGDISAVFEDIRQVIEREGLLPQ